MLKKTRDLTTLRDHLANERTFLAWIRTSIGLMAFGFVIEKFSWFLKHITLLVGKVEGSRVPDLEASTSIFGILLVILGAFLSIFAYVKFKHIEQQIEENAFHISQLLDLLLTVAVFVIGMILVVFLVL